MGDRTENETDRSLRKLTDAIDESKRLRASTRQAIQRLERAGQPTSERDDPAEVPSPPPTDLLSEDDGSDG